MFLSSKQFSLESQRTKLRISCKSEPWLHSESKRISASSACWSRRSGSCAWLGPNWRKVLASVPWGWPLPAGAVESPDRKHSGTAIAVRRPIPAFPVDFAAAAPWRVSIYAKQGQSEFWESNAYTTLCRGRVRLLQRVLLKKKKERKLYFWSCVQCRCLIINAWASCDA